MFIDSQKQMALGFPGKKKMAKERDRRNECTILFTSMHQNSQPAAQLKHIIRNTVTEKICLWNRELFESSQICTS